MFFDHGYIGKVVGDGRGAILASCVSALFRTLFVGADFVPAIGRYADHALEQSAPSDIASCHVVKCDGL